MIILAQNYPMELVFNKILKQDADAILPFLYELNHHEVSLQILSTRLLEMFDQNYECFGIYSEAKLIGTFGIWSMTRHYAGKSCEPDHIYILPELQGKGIGKKIFEFIDDYAKSKGCETAELNSYVHNFRSHKFYMNEGFVIKGYHFLKKL